MKPVTRKTRVAAFALIAALCCPPAASAFAFASTATFTDVEGLCATEQHDAAESACTGIVGGISPNSEGFALADSSFIETTTFKNNRYAIISGSMTWAAAESDCEARGGHLAVITSQAEQDFIEALNTHGFEAYIGGYEVSEGIWRWVTGEEWSYTHWAAGEPSGTCRNRGDTENHLAVWPHDWNDCDGTYARCSYYICEWEGENPHAETTIIRSGSSNISQIGLVGEEIAWSITTAIDGEADVAGYEINLYRDGELIDSETRETSAASVEYRYTPEEEGTYRLEARTLLSDGSFSAFATDDVSVASFSCDVSLDASGMADMNTMTWNVEADGGTGPYTYHCELYKEGSGLSQHEFPENGSGSFTYALSAGGTVYSGNYYAEAYAVDSQGRRSKTVRSESVHLPYAKTYVTCSCGTGVAGDEMVWTVGADLGYGANASWFHTKLYKDGQELEYLQHGAGGNRSIEYPCTPSEKGVYKLVAWTQLSDGYETQPVELSVEVRDEPSLKVELSGVSEDTITWTASTESPNVSTYHFDLYRDGERIESITKSAWSKSCDFAYTCEKSGDYQVAAWCRDHRGRTSQTAVSGVCTMDGTPRILSVDPPQSADLWANLTWDVTASGLGQLTYHYALYRDGRSMALAQSSTYSSSFTYSFYTLGGYRLEIYVTNDEGKSSETTAVPIQVVEGDPPEIRSAEVTLTRADGTEADAGAGQPIDVAVGDTQTWSIGKTGGKYTLRYAFTRTKDGEFYDSSGWVSDGSHAFEFTEPGTYRVLFQVVDLANNFESYSQVVETDEFLCTALRTPEAAEPIAGENRYETAAEIARAAYPDGAEGVIVATGANFPDALGASSLAGLLGYPVVLTEPGALSDAAADAIAELGAHDAIIVGGESAVSADVESALRAYGTVERISGEDRYQTAEAVFAEGLERGGWGGTAIIAAGGNYPDALSISGFAFKEAAPILLCGADGLTAGTQSCLASGGFSRVVVVGGTSAVPASAETWAAQNVASDVVRLGGENRYATSRLIAEFCLKNGCSADGACIATGRNFPDALAGGALVGRTGSIMLLADESDTSSLEVLRSHAADVDGVYFLGGIGVVPQSVRDAAIAAAGL